MVWGYEKIDDENEIEEHLGLILVPDGDERQLVFGELQPTEKQLVGAKKFSTKLENHEGRTLVLTGET